MNYYYVNRKKRNVLFKIRNVVIKFSKIQYYYWKQDKNILDEVILANKKLTEKHEDNYWRFAGVYSKRTSHKQYCDYLGKELIRYQLSYKDLRRLLSNNPFLKSVMNGYLSDLCYD